MRGLAGCLGLRSLGVVDLASDLGVVSLKMSSFGTRQSMTSIAGVLEPLLSLELVPGDCRSSSGETE